MAKEYIEREAALKNMCCLKFEQRRYFEVMRGKEN